MGHSLEFWDTSSSRCKCLLTVALPSITDLSQSYGRISNPTLQSIMPARTTLYQQLSAFPSLSVLSSTLDSALLDIDGLSISWNNSSQSCLIKATTNTWSRAARRRKAGKSSRPFSSSRFSPIVMQCRIYCREDVSSEKHKLLLEYQWVEGSERSVFDSFVNHVNRKVSSITVTQVVKH